MNIYVSLFSASITLAGFIAVFLIFRYRQIDTYVDTRKSRIRSLLEKKIKKDPSIDVKIENIGKNPQDNDAEYFSQFNKEIEAVATFVNDILEYRRMRDSTVCRGLWSIGIWGVLSLIYLIIYAIGPCLFSSIRCCATVIGISIGFFVSSMVFTLYFVFKTLLAKRRA